MNKPRSAGAYSSTAKDYFRAHVRLFSTCLVALMFMSCGGSAAPDKRAVIAQHQKLAQALYAETLQSAQALLLSVRQLVEQPSAEHLARARAAWIRARSPYSRSEALRFGHWPVDEFDARLNSWPLDEGLIDYVSAPYPAAQDNALAHANLVNAESFRLGARVIDVGQLSSGLLAGFAALAPVETAVLTGYHAIEFLLWGQDLNAEGPGQRPWTDFAATPNTCTNGPLAWADEADRVRPCRRRAQLLVAMSELLVQNLIDLQRVWADDLGSYASRLVAGDPDAALRRIFFSLANFSAEELAGERLQVAWRTGAQEEEQDCFSDQTHASLQNNAAGIALFYRGQYGVLSGPSPRDLVRAADAALADQIDHALQTTALRMQALVAAAENGQPFDRLILSASPLLEAAMLALRQQAELLELAAQRLGLGALNPALQIQGAGGSTTLARQNPDVVLQPDAFSQPATNLTALQRGRFAVGNSLFTNAWVSAPATTVARDGLGPLYNAAACQNCHIRDGRGHAPAGPDDDAVSAVVRLTRPGGLPDPVYGLQIQDHALPSLPPEARVVVDWELRRVDLAGGESVELRKPKISLEQLAYGPLAPDTRLSLRIAPPMIGQGLLDAIPEDVLSNMADPLDTDEDGISGRMRRLPDGRPGRHGWKAAQADVAAQTASALALDIGITSVLVPTDECSNGQKACRKLPNGGQPEIDQTLFDDLVFYASHLAVPARRWTAVDAVLEGEKLFEQLGCSTCHRPSLRTGILSHAPALSEQNIAPYTDLLLHDMGPELSADHDEFDAAASEWRTPPLWGLHLTKAISGYEAGFLHDGRARDFKEAILWHGGEAQAAREAFRQLPLAQREQLIWFLKSL